MPQTEQAVCGSFGDLHWGHSTVATAVAFQFARRQGTKNLAGSFERADEKQV